MTPTASQIVLDPEVVESLLTSRGGYTRAAVVFIGGEWPAKRGWKRRHLGEARDRRRYIELLEAIADRDEHRKHYRLRSR